MTDENIKEEKSDLEKKLEEVQEEKQKNESVDSSELDVNWLKSKVVELEKQLKDQSEVVKRAQYDYVNLKMDFDRMQRVWNDKSISMEVDSLISNVKKFLPFLESLRKSLDTIPVEQKKDTLVKWLQMMYDNFLKTLDSMNIKVIDSIWLAPDSIFHEPVNVVEVEDKKMKWKIVEEWERGFYYEKDWDKRVVVPSKVIVWK